MPTFKNRALTLATLGLLSGSPLTQATLGHIQQAEAVVTPTEPVVVQGGGGRTFRPAPHGERFIDFPESFKHASELRFRIASELGTEFVTGPAPLAAEISSTVRFTLFSTKVEARFASADARDGSSAVRLESASSVTFATPDARGDIRTTTLRLDGAASTTFVTPDRLARSGEGEFRITGSADARLTSSSLRSLASTLDLSLSSSTSVATERGFILVEPLHGSYSGVLPLTVSGTADTLLEAVQPRLGVYSGDLVATLSGIADIVATSDAGPSYVRRVSVPVLHVTGAGEVIFRTATRGLPEDDDGAVLAMLLAEILASEEDF